MSETFITKGTEQNAE